MASDFLAQVSEDARNALIKDIEQSIQLHVRTERALKRKHIQRAAQKRPPGPTH
jgi:hypothetical protein